MRENVEYLSAPQTAKFVRVQLSKSFPGIKFSVRSHCYSGGSSINVQWTDGPSCRQVERTINHFGGKTFDGMDDSTHYHDTQFEGRTVHFSNWSPSCSRSVTGYDQLHTQALEMIRAKCRLDETGTRFGNDWIDNLASNMVHACDFRDANPLERAFRFAVLREEM